MQKPVGGLEWLFVSDLSVPIVLKYNRTTLPNIQAKYHETITETKCDLNILCHNGIISLF